MIQTLDRLKIMLWNVENLFLLSDEPLLPAHLELDQTKWNRLSTSVYDNKPLEKCKHIARIIQEENPDLVLFCEVGGAESLQNFSKLFLQDTYSPALIEGNSNRHIDVGYLIKKGLPFYFDIITNKNRPIHYLYPHERQSLAFANSQPQTSPQITSHKFSRDAVELHCFLHDREKPFFISLLTHLKSRLDPDGIDPNGSERRQAELKTLIEIYLETEAKFNNKVPILVAGDFNGNASENSTDPEFNDLYSKTQLRDACALSQIPDNQRASFYQVGRSQTDGRQIDYCFLSPLLAKYLNKSSTKIYRFKNTKGEELPPPATLESKSYLPSDHYPLILEVNALPMT